MGCVGGEVNSCGALLRQYLGSKHTGSESARNRLDEQERAYPCQAYVEVLKESVTVEPVIDCPAEISPQKSDGQREKIVMSYVRSPQAREPIAGHTYYAGGEKISLQSRAKVLRRPPAHGAVYHERRAVHSVGAAEDSRKESAAQEPAAPVLL